MVTISDSPPKEYMPGPRKAAILMVILGDEASRAILKELDEDEVQKI
jgi:flagellar motor switch protein FliG